MTSLHSSMDRGHHAQPLLRAHPLFPTALALWCAALFGLSTLAVRGSLFDGALPAALLSHAPWLGLLLHLVLAVLMGGAGAALGRGVARSLVRSPRLATVAQAMPEPGPPGPFPGDMAPPGDSPHAAGKGLLASLRSRLKRGDAEADSPAPAPASSVLMRIRQRDAHPDAPPRAPIRAHEEFGFDLDAFPVAAPPPAQEEARRPAVSVLAAEAFPKIAEAIPSWMVPDAPPEIAAEAVPEAAREDEPGEPDEPHIAFPSPAEADFAGFPEEDRAPAQPAPIAVPIPAVPMAADAVPPPLRPLHLMPAYESGPDASSLAHFPPLPPRAGPTAAERIAGAPLEDLSPVELVERLAIAMQRRGEPDATDGEPHDELDDGDDDVDQRLSDALASLRALS